MLVEYPSSEFKFGAVKAEKFVKTVSNWCVVAVQLWSRWWGEEWRIVLAALFSELIGENVQSCLEGEL